MKFEAPLFGRADAATTCRPPATSDAASPSPRTIFSVHAMRDSVRLERDSVSFSILYLYLRKRALNQSSLHQNRNIVRAS
jgi:hypothetical protein